MSILPLPIVLTAGLALGFFYFGGLWLTVRELPAMRRPALWMLASFAGRTGLSVAGFYLVMDGRWERLGVCFLGFLLARTLLVHRDRARWQ
jgi:F1F0 ATPase subunit 2